MPLYCENPALLHFLWPSSAWHWFRFSVLNSDTIFPPWDGYQLVVVGEHEVFKMVVEWVSARNSPKVLRIPAIAKDQQSEADLSVVATDSQKAAGSF